MNFKFDVLDDALRALYPLLISRNETVTTTRGLTTELLGVCIEICQPRARISQTETRGKPFSCLGEFLWYLTRDNKLDFIKYYIPSYVRESEDNVTVYGGYGPRLFKQRNHNQILNVINLLKNKPNSRRAIIQIFNAEDLDRPPLGGPLGMLIQHRSFDQW